MTLPRVSPRALCVAVFSALVLPPAVTFAAAPTPAPPKEYDVQLRYRIHAGRNERLRQFDELIAFLNSVGFKKSPGSDTEAEDPSENMMTGTIASRDARKLLGDHRVKTILLTPPGFKAPDEGPVKVQIEIAAGYPTERQLALYEQTRAKLETLGFRENVGYDNRGLSRLLGTVPANELPSLLKDLRGQPGGWLAAAAPAAELPQPIRGISPLRVVEVIPDPTPQAAKDAAAEQPAADKADHLAKVSPDLRALAGQDGQAKPVRVEVILSYAPSADDASWRRDLSGVGPDLVIEGRLGPLVTVQASPKQALALADVPTVSTVRLPRPAAAQVRFTPGKPDQNLRALQAAGVKLDLRGRRGKGARVAIVDDDFRGYRRFTKGPSPRLPAGTRYVDLTAERNATVLPDDNAGEPEAVGHGTECALAVAQAAPDAELTLIRIDPVAPHQLEEVARTIAGEGFRSESYHHRVAQLAAEREQLDGRQRQLVQERKIVLDKFTDTRERDTLMKKPQDKLTAEEKELLDEIKRYDAYFKSRADFERDHKAYHDRAERFLALEREFRGLHGIRAVVNTLLWDEGYPLANDNVLSSYFDERPFRAALWFHAAGDTRGQLWSDYFRDGDGNGVMEFAAPDVPVRPGHWTRELNFLAWQPHGQQASPELPDKVKVRVTMQWREAHHPESYRTPGDRYREPLAKLRLVVLRQKDPEGKKLPGDDMEVVARSEGLPQRLVNEPTFAVYEQSVEFVVDPAARYALRVEGRAPVGTRPGDEPTLPSQRRTGELWPRIFVDAEEPAARKEGRPVFLDFLPDGVAPSRQ